MRKAVLKYRQAPFLRLLATLMLFSGARSQHVTTMFQGNSGHTGVVSPRSIRSIVGFAFAFKTEGPVRSTPAVTPEIVCFGSGDGNIYALERFGGTELWRFETGGPVTSSPAVSGKTVYASSRDGNLYALDLVNGNRKWSFQFGGDLDYLPGFDYYLSSPVVENGILYVGAGDGFVYSFDAGSGKLLWKSFLGSRVRTSPALAANLVIVGTMSGHVVALTQEDGSNVWKFALTGADLKFEDFGFDRSAVVSSPSTDGEIIVVGGRDGFVYALKIKDGTLVWKYDHKVSWAISTMGHHNGSVFGGSSDGKFFHALDKRTGREHWRYTTHGPVWASPCFSDQEVICADYAGNLFALERASGRELWKFNLGDRIHGSPVLVDGILYVGCDDGYLYALQSSDRTAGSTHPVRRAVFWEKPRGYSWFRNDVDEYVRDCFERDGYEVVNAEQLKHIMEAQIGGGIMSVVVFAENRVPDEFEGDESNPGLFRRYLEAGGKAVWLGACPFAYRRDSTDKLVELDFSFGSRILGINYPGKHLDRLGLYGSRPTRDGFRWGLKDWWVGFGSVEPSEVTTVLALDESGMASAWVRNYGGPEGTGLVQLWIPRDRPVDLTFVKQAAEHGLNPKQEFEKK